MKCRICNSPFHPATGHMFSERFALCGTCAKDFWTWRKLRMNSMQAVLKKNKCSESFHDAACKSIIGDNGERIPDDGEVCIVWNGNRQIPSFMRRSKGFKNNGNLVTYSLDGKSIENWERWQSFKFKPDKYLS